MTDIRIHGDTEPDAALILWVPVSELAKMRGVARQVAYRQVDKLAERGLIEVRIGKRGQKLVSPAQVERALSTVADLARSRGTTTRRADVDEPMAISGSAAATYTREQARRMTYQADIARLDLEERLKKLVSIDALSEGVVQAGAAIRRAVERLPQFDDEIRAACERSETNELTILLKRIANRICNEAADTLQATLTEGTQWDGNETA